MRYTGRYRLKKQVLEKIGASLQHYNDSQRLKQQFGAMEANLHLQFRKGKISYYEFANSIRILKEFMKVKL